MTKQFSRGEIVYRPAYFEIRTFGGSALTNPSFNCVDLDRLDAADITVRGRDLVDSFVSASAFDDEELITRTELASLLTTAGALPFTVVFTKADGGERELTGVLVEHEDLLGRSMVRDLRIKRLTVTPSRSPYD